MVMEDLLFPPTRPNVSLEIRLPTSKSPQQGSEAMELGYFPMRSNNNTTTTTDLSLSPSANPTVRPIKGIPLYQYHNPPPFPSSINVHRRQQRQSRSRIFSGIPPRKSARAPRMKWTTSLHARFVHAVELLGGHERATPKSVLELMDVKDLTLAHVKSHLQMYRTVKSTDKPTSSSVLMDGFENGSEREECYDYNLFQFQSSQHWERKSAKEDNGYPGLWTNSSSGVHLHGTLGDNWMEKKSTFEKEMRGTKDLGRSCEEKYYPYLEDNPAVKPNLEFTLGI